MGLSLITAPIVEPITTTEAKEHLRIDGSESNALVDSLIKAARRRAESMTGRSLINQTWDYVLDAPTGRTIKLPLSPVSSVTSISFTDTDAVTTVYSADNYVVDSLSVPGRVVLKSGQTWNTDLQEANGMAIRFVAGYGATPEDIPDDVRQAMFLMIGHWYEHREEASEINLLQIPTGAGELLWPYRVFMI